MTRRNSQRSGPCFEVDPGRGLKEGVWGGGYHISEPLNCMHRNKKVSCKRLEAIQKNRYLTVGLKVAKAAGRIETQAVTKQRRGSAGIGRDGHTRHAGSSDKVRHAPP